MLQFGIAYLTALFLAFVPAPVVFSNPFYEKFESGYYLWTFALALACWVSLLRLRPMIGPNQTDSVIRNGRSFS